MTFHIKERKPRRGVGFKKRMPSTNTGNNSSNQSSKTSASSRPKTSGSDEVPRPEVDNSDPLSYTIPPQSGFIIEELPPDDTPQPDHHPFKQPHAMSSTFQSPQIPTLFTTLPPTRDLLMTPTSILQDQTIQEILPFHTQPSLSSPLSSVNEKGVPQLDRKRHIAFLHKNLRRLPAPFVAADASRPWMFYWALAGLSALGEGGKGGDVEGYRERLISTVEPIQNSGGGFGGGNGQMSHLAPTYAIILSLAMVGGKDAMDVIDRKAMWKWLGRLKQADGGLQMSEGGEEDVRGAYCAVTLLSMLDLPLELPQESPVRSQGRTTFLDGLPEWVARCQTFEGGISARPDSEAHGAYAFCALACLCIIDDPHVVIPKYLDVPRLISWLSARQYAPEGGFAGRTNKLVDGCYSHWVGGCWPLIEACLEGPTTTSTPKSKSASSLYSREGLIRYIMCCCQDQTKRGGLRDKPSHNSDSYHTCYVLAGLSSAQHKWHFNGASRRDQTLTSAYQWTSEKLTDEEQVYDEANRVATLHPVFVIPEGAAEEMRGYYVAKGSF